MPDTSLGLTYPASTAHTRIWEHIQELANDANAALVTRTPLLDSAQVSAVTTLTTTMSDIPGATKTLITTLPNTRALIIWSPDFQCTTASTATPYSVVAVDGVDQAPNAVYFPGGTAAVGARCTPCNAFVVTLATAGAHTFKMRAAVATANGVWKVNNQTSSISVLALPW
ncbi:hypothetical protein AB0J68_01520 [Micromonospora sp. NPDC049580]|uniref:hypothetical protein n=1 Tax=Micromonospora sp. NPDC049580 TaxID=3154832 RepID=UPI0034169DAA